jgi:ureidoglycolate lyase
MTPRRVLNAEPLTAEAFKPYGDVIEVGEHVRRYGVNRGDALRYHDLAKVDVLAGGGRPIISIFRALPHSLPLSLTVMERHPLGSQAFVPLGPHPYLLVVALAGPPPEPAQLRCFLAAPGQGVNYARGIWHHPLLALETTSDFLVVDRGGPPLPTNCDEHALDGAPVWVQT